MGRLARYANDLRSFPGDARAALKRDGWRGVWDEFAGRTVQRVFVRGRLLILAQELAAVPERAPPEGVVIEPFAGDWSRLAPLISSRMRSRFQRRAARGRICLVAWRGELPLGHTWLSPQVEPDLEFPMRSVPPGVMYMGNLYVAGYARNGGIGSALVTAEMLLARQMGFREGWRLISPANAASLRTMAKAGRGTRLEGEMHFLKLLGWVRTRRVQPSDRPA